MWLPIHLSLARQNLCVFVKFLQTSGSDCERPKCDRKDDCGEDDRAIYEFLHSVPPQTSCVALSSPERHLPSGCSQATEPSWNSEAGVEQTTPKQHRI